MCAHVCECATAHTRDQRINFGVQFSPSTFMWVQGLNLSFCGKHTFTTEPSYPKFSFLTFTFFIKIIYLFLMCAAFPACVYHVSIWCPRRLEEGRSPGTEVTPDCEWPCGCWEPNCDPHLQSALGSHTLAGKGEQSTSKHP